MRRPVCYHGETTCPFCGYPIPARVRVRPRCAACGRFRKRGPDHCPRCVERGYRALRLPFPRRRRSAA